MIISRATVKTKTFEDNNIPNGEHDLILYRSGDFYAFGYECEIKDPWGFAINRCGTIQEVKEALNRWINGNYTSKSEKAACKTFLSVLEG